MNFAKILTNRWTISAINLLILGIVYSTLHEALSLLINPVNNYDEIEELLDGVGMIFVAYGVALEERDTLMKFFKLYPEYYNECQNRADHNCHFFGLWLLLMGLFMEVTVELVKLPNRIFNTQGFDEIIFGIGFVFCAGSAVLLLRLSYLLLRGKSCVEE